MSYKLIEWREKYGYGNHKQVDDKPFGGGTGMVLQPEPIYRALKDEDNLSKLLMTPSATTIHSRLLPNNSAFYDYQKKNPTNRKVTISLTPRGFPINQKTVEWLAENFEEMAILCGRYEGFDARVSEFVDLELSVGNFVTNGGEVPAMALIEAVSRLLPDFVTKDNSVMHDSFSSSLNFYTEQAEYVFGKGKNGKSIKSIKDKLFSDKIDTFPLFDDIYWQTELLPQIEHPQYTRPETWNNWSVPQILITGDHAKIQLWRKKWFLDI